MSSPRPPIDRGAGAIGLLTVVAANCLYLAGLSTILDPVMSMEPLYIDMAQQPIASIVAADPAWGPLYALWLKPFRAALGDPLAVYLANTYALSLAVSILIYLYVLLLSRRAVPAVGAALLLLVSDLNVPLTSKVSAFALLLLLAGLTLSELVPRGARRMVVAGAGLLLASYARPELYPAAVLLFLVALWLARTERTAGRGVLWWPLSGLAFTAAVAIWIGTPVFSPSFGEDRLLVAFREHFAWNWARWHNGMRYYLAIWEQEFGDAHTTLQAVRNNPAAVFHHLFDNLVGTVAFMTGTALDHYPFIAPVTRPAAVRAEDMLLTAAAFGSLVLVALRPGLRRQMHDRYGHVVLPHAAVALCSFAASIVIFPVPHYLVIPAVLLLLAGILAATVIFPPNDGRASWRRGVVAAVICLVAVPKPFVLPSAYVVQGAPFKARLDVTRKVTDTIQFIRGLGLPAPVHVLTMTDGIGDMLGTGFEEIKVWQRGTQPLDAYVRDRHVDVIVTLEAGRDSFLVDDPYWTLVQNTPDAAGFTLLPVGGPDAARVFVRSELLKKAPPLPAGSPPH
jgi:hypothetical protein